MKQKIYALIGLSLSIIISFYGYHSGLFKSPLEKCQSDLKKEFSSYQGIIGRSINAKESCICLANISKGPIDKRNYFSCINTEKSRKNMISICNKTIAPLVPTELKKTLDCACYTNQSLASAQIFYKIHKRSPSAEEGKKMTVNNLETCLH